MTNKTTLLLMAAIAATTTFAQFTSVPGQLARISSSADGSEVWGVNLANQVLRWNGSAFVQITPGALTQISAGSASNIWGLNSTGAILQAGQQRLAAHVWHANLHLRRLRRHGLPVEQQQLDTDLRH